MEQITVSAAQWKKYQDAEVKAKLSARKATVKNLLYVEKAKDLGIEVTKAEVEARIAEEDAKRASETSQA